MSGFEEVTESSETSTVWPPEDKICYITEELIVALSGQRHLPQISALDLHLRDGSMGKIRRIEGLSELINLRQLNLSYNAIIRIENLDGLSNLVELNLAENDIRHMPGLFGLVSLQRLNLSGNRVQRIPEGVRALKNLENLRLARNQLTELEDVENLSPLSKLTELRMDDNPFTSGSASDRAETRAFVVFCLIHLTSLDGADVTADERRDADRARQLVQVERHKRTDHISVLTADRRAQTVTATATSTVPPSLSMRTGPTNTEAATFHGQRPKVGQGKTSAAEDAYPMDEEMERRLADKTIEAAEAQAELKRLKQEYSSSRPRTPSSPEHEEEKYHRRSDQPTSSRSPTDTRHRSQAGEGRHPTDTRHRSQAGESPVSSEDGEELTHRKHDRRAEGKVERSGRVDERTIEHKHRDSPQNAEPSVLSSRHTPPARSPSGSPGSGSAGRRIADLSDRVERLTALLLQSEEDKRSLTSELDTAKKKLTIADAEIKSLRSAVSGVSNTDIAPGSSYAEVDLLRRELYAFKQRDINASDEISKLKDQLSRQVSQSSDTLRITSAATEENSRLKLDYDSSLREIASLRAEVQSLRTETYTLRDKAAAAAIANEDRTNLEKDRSKAHEIISRYKLDLDRARSEVDSLQADYSQAQRDLKASKERVLRVTEENEDLLTQIRKINLTVGESPDRFNEAVTQLRVKCSSLETELALAVDEKEQLARKIVNLTNAAKEDEAYKPLRAETAYSTQQPVFQQSANAHRNVASYLDEPSSDFSDRNNHSEVDLARLSAGVKPVVRHAVRAGKLSPVHQSAAEVVSALLLQELKVAPGSFSSVGTGAKTGRGGGRGEAAVGLEYLSQLEDACTRAALRLVHTAMHVVNNGGVTPDQVSQISPLAALGDDAVLRALVERTQHGATALEDIAALREEKQKIEECVEELKQSLAALDKKRFEKDDIVTAVNAECEAAKERGRMALQELQRLADVMLAEKEELESVGKAKLGIQREIEALNRKMTDLSSLADIESKNLTSVRSRLAAARDDTDKWELRAQETRQEADTEEKRLRDTKAIAGDQIKLLQQEVGRLHGDIKAGRRALEDSEKIRRNLDEEILKRRSDADSQNATIGRDLDDAMRKTASLRAEQRSIAMEIEKLSLEKRKMMDEVSNLEIRKMSVGDELLSVEEQTKRRADAAERQVAEAEKKLKVLKESIATINSEHLLALHTLDELKAQCGDLERVAETRKRSIDDEVTIAQQQAAVSIRASRAAVTGVEQKRAELEVLCSECRLAERKLEDSKRNARELEISAEAVRESVKQLEMEKSRTRSEIATYKREEEDLRTHVQNLKLAIDNESRACEDTRRRLLLLAEEEAAMKDGENRLRSSLAALKKGIEESQVEIEEQRSSSERERRLLSELRGKKNMSESEVSRTDDEISFAREQLSTLEQQQEEMRVSCQRVKAEVMQLHKELASSQRRTAEALRIEDQLRRKEKEAAKNNERLLAESDSITSRLSIERAQLESIRNERDRCSNELRYTQESQAALTQEIASYNISYESLKANYANLDAARANILQEIGQLRETARLEVSRIDRINETYSGVEKRLSEVRESLVKTEKTYEKARAQTVEEEHRVDTQRRSLRKAAEDVRLMERQMADANKALHEDRMQAIAELNRLNAAKASLQEHVIQLSETQLRRQASTGDLTISPPPSLQQRSPSGQTTNTSMHVLPSDRLRSLSHFSDIGASNKDVLGWKSFVGKVVERRSGPDAEDYSDDTFCSHNDDSSTSSEHAVEDVNRNYSRFANNSGRVLGGFTGPTTGTANQKSGGRVEGGGQGTTQGLAEEVRRLQEKSAAILQTSRSGLNPSSKRE